MTTAHTIDYTHEKGDTWTTRSLTRELSGGTVSEEGREGGNNKCCISSLLRFKRGKYFMIIKFHDQTKRTIVSVLVRELSSVVREVVLTFTL